MTIYVDADACPVVRQTEETARRFAVPVVLLCDTNHVLFSEYSAVVTVDAGADAVDLALVNRCRKGDVVITQDYGVAAMALSKGAFVLHQSGREFTEENITGLLSQRALAQKARRAHAKHHMKGPAKRTAEDDLRFTRALEELLARLIAGRNEHDGTEIAAAAVGK